MSDISPVLNQPDIFRFKYDLAEKDFLKTTFLKSYVVVSALST